MDRRLVRNWLLAFVVSTSALLSARFAMAAPNDAAAQKLRDQAIDQDYIGTNYAAAEKKLNDALSLCQKTSDCSPFIRARVHCDLGVVEFMLKKVDLARTEFATALLEDPNVDLDKDLSNTDVQREFATVKGDGAAPPAASGTPPALPPPPAATPLPSGGVTTGGLAHVPPTRQKVQTPLPLYVEAAPDLGATKVIVRYKPVGARDWKIAILDKVGNGFGTEIPCSDVGGREGELQYYVQALDTNGDLVAASGRSATPYSVAIVKVLEGEAAHLPGQPAPQACKPGTAAAKSTSSATTETGDCPPGFPGCGTEAGPLACESKEDCVAGEECVERVCQKASDRPYKKNWLSFGVQAELLLLPGQDNACLGNSGYTCFLSGTNNYYADLPATGVDDSVIGGFAAGPMLRIAVGYDRALLPNVTAGGRLGYAVLGSGPQRPASGGRDAGPSFMPLHVEARLAYWFGRNVLSRKGLRFYAFAAGGMMQVDASEPIDAKLTPGSAQVNVDAWKKTGLGFGALGPGLMVAVTPNSGFVVELKPVVLFPTFGFALGAQLGYTIGL